MNQWHFEFHEYQAAFELFFRRKKKDPALCFVISRNPYVSGYWIERNAKPDGLTEVYRTVHEVKLLQQRLRRRRANRNTLSLGGVVV